VADRLDRRLRSVAELARHHRRDDLARVGSRLLAQDHVVAVEDARVDHRVPVDLEHEDVAVPDELGRHRVDLVDVLLGHDRRAGGDAAQKRHGAGGAALGGQARLGVVEELDRPGLGGVDPEVALALERLHV
jgi:hypothetical protein